jgi:hypothetical protein
MKRIYHAGQITANEIRSPNTSAVVLAPILFYGGLWGIAEATLGYLLHLAAQVTLLSSPSGLIMFPIGLLFMVAAVRAAGRPSAAFATAVVTAGIKLSSLALPTVSLRFVVSPALAILAEGAVVFLLLGATDLRPNRLLPAKALAASVAWRGLFLLASLVLGLRGGILAKPTTLLLGFLFVDSAVNALIITAGSLLAARARRAPFGPAPAVPAASAVLIVAVVLEGLLRVV